MVAAARAQVHAKHALRVTTRARPMHWSVRHAPLEGSKLRTGPHRAARASHTRLKTKRAQSLAKRATTLALVGSTTQRVAAPPLASVLPAQRESTTPTMGTQRRPPARRVSKENITSRSLEDVTS